ncbi:MAG: cation diffusion facilitator family transporter [Anaerolineae bacterium]|nr:cation diffusion facilitator family transporter [Anaerolineae bacterium]MCI0610363.1 cation diffusion facilitator family transporter [Anaerolineae bacterium]
MSQHDKHDHNHDHDQEHEHSKNPIIEWFQHTFTPHDHGYQTAALDAALATDRGLWAVKVSLVALLLTAVFQVVIVAISGSVALLADTIHNFSDALTAIPLGIAFTLSRRARNSRYTYGYGRAEDIAGVIIVLMIFITAVEAIRQSILKIMDPQSISNLGWVAVAAVIGFLGNEFVAIFRIRVGKQIGSAALVADGNHARTDGFTSLAVLAGVIGVWLGYPLLDPIVGLGIGAAILVIVWNSARDIYYRVMDAVEPEITELVKNIASKVQDVMEVNNIAIRWVGHRQRAEFHITVDCQMSTCKSHIIAENVRHALFHALPALADITVHVDPCECENCPDTHLSGHAVSSATA